MKSAIVHQYFKKDLDGATILLQVDPVRYMGLQLLIREDGKVEKTKRELDENIFEELERGLFAFRRAGIQYLSCGNQIDKRPPPRRRMGPL